MKPVRPQSLVHRGVVDAVAFYFASPPLAVEEARRRIVSLWGVGSVVYRVSDGLILRLPSPRRVVASDAPGVPLTEHKGFLTAAPLRQNEIAALAPPKGAVVLVRDGGASVRILTSEPVEDPATWLDLGDYDLVPVITLGEPPAVPRLLAEPVPFDARARFGNILPPDPERQRVMEELQSAMGKKSGSRNGGGGGFSAANPLWLEAIGRTIGLLFGQFLAMFFPERSRVARNPTKSNGSTPQQKTPANRDTPWDTMRRLAARLMILTGLAGMIGRKQAQYLNRMMELFERGELQDALRYAIPLRSPIDDTPAPPELGVPTPRDNLNLTMQPETGRGSAIGLGEELFADLQSLYRRAITKLESEGRIEEAAFIFADLLQEYAEAVALLERHKRFRLAAELAEGHALPPGLVVRLWFLAGETERAVLIARRTGAFADAVLRLERSDKERSAVLRGLWARERARAGDYGAAVEILWPLESARSVALEWIRRASEGGGTVGGRMLARWLSLEESEANRQQAIDLLKEKGGERAGERLAFAEMLPSLSECVSARPLARLAARTLWSDAHSGWSSVSAPNFREILRVAEDGGLRADMLPLPSTVRKPLAERNNSPLEITVDANDTGSLTLYDAAYLPNGQCLIALGEAGTRLLSRDGRTVVHFDQPAQRLVVSDSGNHAIGLARRGSVWRSVRFDLVTRRATPWKDAALKAFAPDYDGSLWFVGIGNDLLAIDATSDNFDALWRMPNLEGSLITIARNATDCSLLIRYEGDTDPFGNSIDSLGTDPPVTRWERWHYVLPALTLRDRGAVEIVTPENAGEIVAVSAAGAVAQAHRFNASSDESYLVLAKTARPDHRQDSKISIPLEGETAHACCLTDEGVLAVTTDPNGSVCHLFPAVNPSASPIVRVTVAGATKVVPRMTPEALTLCDDKGRLLVLSLLDGTLLRNLRIS